MGSGVPNPQDDFAQHFIANQAKLYSYIATLIPNRSDAEDILQRTSLILWQKWDQFDGSRPFLPWARGIALNEVRNLLRRSDRKNVHLSEPVVALLAQELEDEHPEERLEAMSVCLERLEARQRHLLEQCYLGTHGIKSVAASMNTTADAIYMRLHRVRKFLVECINKRLASELA